MCNHNPTSIKLSAEILFLIVATLHRELAWVSCVLVEAVRLCYRSARTIAKTNFSLSSYYLQKDLRFDFLQQENGVLRSRNDGNLCTVLRYEAMTLSLVSYFEDDL